MLHLSLILGVIATLTEAQSAGLPDLSGLPECATASALSGIKSTGCKLTDYACICASPTFIKATGLQIAASCSPDDQKKALEFSNQLCAQAGVTVPADGLAVGSAAPVPAPSATEEAKDVPSATEAADAGATETETDSSDASEETSTDSPPYPVPTGNASNSTSGSNSTVPFAGSATRSGIALSGLVVALMVAGGFAMM